MFSPLFGVAAMALVVLQPTDTTIAVRNGTRLEVRDVGGEVVVNAWSREEVRVVAPESNVEVLTAGSVLRVRSGGGQNRGRRSVDIRVEVPAWMAVRITGPQTDATVVGTAADITVETVRGDILVRGGAGRVFLRSVQGDIRVENARGRVEIRGATGDIAVRAVTGDISVENVKGDIDLSRIDAQSVNAATIHGDISFTGSIREEGRYRLATHNGDIAIAIPEDTDAVVSVATHAGEFHSDFPVRLDRAGPGGRYDFVMGSGRARIELESFNGEIRLSRPRASMGSTGSAAHWLASVRR